jgi:hypothetical protein
MLDQYVTGNFPTAELPQINRTLVISLQGLDAVMPIVGNRVDLTDYKIGRLHGKLSAPALPGSPQVHRQEPQHTRVQSRASISRGSFRG